MKLFRFDEVDERLELVPLAARRALDHAGQKLPLPGWQSLALESRRALADAGSSTRVDIDSVLLGIRTAEPPATSMARALDPPTERAPAEVTRALGPERPLPPALWASLSALDRYALAKVAGKNNAQRLAAAYAEIVGASAISTHLSATGEVRMVDVAEKQTTLRSAVAESRVTVNRDALERLETHTAPKGDVLATARLAGIMAAKRTAELIPLCHPLQLTRVAVDLELDPAQSAVVIEARVEALDRTGVEMEALVAASVAALTVYDMLKAFDRAMELGPTRLLAKSGGRSGDFRR